MNVGEEMVIVLNIFLFIINFDYVVLLHFSTVDPMASQGTGSNVCVHF